jgi:myo-inositol-1(or 4)-monophosphatase
VSFSAAERARALAVAVAAARAGGEILLGHLGAIERGSVARKSSARDLVTRADLESERAIVALLRAAFPAHAIEAEEEVQDDATRTSPRWFLDPLDGTVNFVHALPCFAVSLACWVDGSPEVAVVHAPRLGELFHATRGGGAWLGSERLSVSHTRALGEALLATGFPYRREQLVPSNLEHFARFFPRVRDLRRLAAAALDQAWTAAGRFDGFWEFHLAPHDVAAGGLLVCEAGGRVSDAAGGAAWLRGGSIVAAGAHLHPRILAGLQG